MARKFQIGDTVEVVPEAIPCSQCKPGHRGKVVAYTSGIFPYDVERRNGAIGCFDARELKLIKRRVKKQKK